MNLVKPFRSKSRFYLLKRMYFECSTHCTVDLMNSVISTHLKAFQLLESTDGIGQAFQLKM